MSERTPLLHDPVTVEEDILPPSPSSSSSLEDYNHIYDRFTPSQKRFITLVVSMAGLIGPFASGSFIPIISEIAKDLNTTVEVINYTVGVYIFVIALGNLIWAPYAGYYGRQPVYLCSLPLITIGSLVTAGAAATISDIYKLEERGTAMGVFFGFILLGPPLAPISGGFLATYASWRIMQVVLGVLGFITFMIVLFYLPETIHPGERGIDKAMIHKKLIRQVKTYDGVLDLGLVKPLRGYVTSQVTCNIPECFVIVIHFDNLLQYVHCFPWLLSISYAPSALIIPLPFTLGSAYGLDTPAAIGSCFLPSGLGNISGAIVAGRIADATVIRGRKRRHGQWYPEDRLLATIPGGLVLIPLAMIVFAYTVTYIPGNIGLAICLMCLFFNGMGVDMVLTTSATYLVDILRTRGAEAVAVSSATRNGFGAIATALVVPMLNEIGLIKTNFIAAFCGWAAFACLAITIKCGDRLRAVVDVGFTNIKEISPMKASGIAHGIYDIALEDI
ncbi:hypothetical protein Clacol_009563 [Clathrus columnatus]|uniref:Major facilitator superfamily (MFS) profile domain-containing protein n=1 Tax=Clathrus columnatus TaxID=1419009 RepID=A0AAV5AKU2_9AGAM|nr:hypothetical protein Clacol_009563 [Clathrus columnatus]